MTLLNKPAQSETLRVLDIVDGTTVDGPGLRTAIYLAGCNHRCPGCHNPQSWDFDAGEAVDIDRIVDHVAVNDFNVTLTGGDPLYQAVALLPLVRRIHSMGKTIWCYTGFHFGDIVGRQPYSSLLNEIDVLVDGPFIEALRDTTLHFRGSSNQRIIELHPTPRDITDTFGLPPEF